MKFITALSLLAIVATAASKPIDKNALERDFTELLDLRPMKQIDELFRIYFDTDDEFKNYLRYAMSEEYRDLFAAAQKTPEARAWLNFLDQSGMKAYQYINAINDGLGIAHLVPTENVAMESIDKDIEITGGLQGLVDDISKYTPYEKFEELHGEKLKTSPDYAYFIERIFSHEFSKLTVNLIFTTEFSRLMQSMNAANVDIVALKNLQCVLIGIRNC